MQNIIYKFFEPLKFKPSFWIKVFTHNFVITFFDVLYILLIQYMTQAIISSNFDSLNFLLIISLILTILRFIFDYFTIHWWDGWPMFAFKLEQILNDIYIKKYINLNNHKVESIWTWKFLSIIQDWIWSWAWYLYWAIKLLAWFLVYFLFSLYLISQSWILFLVWFIILFIIINLFFIFINQKFVLPIRKFQVEDNNFRRKQFVRIIMSKFEIFLNNKSDYETTKLNEVIENILQRNKIIANYFFLMFSSPQILYYLFELFVFFYFWYSIINWEFNISILLVYLLVIWRLRKITYDLFQFYKDFSKNLPSIIKLWETFDQIDTIDLNEKWAIFEIKKWEIRFENVSFKYDTTKSNIIEKFNIIFEWWKTNALVWPSWSWKTTILKLVSWFNFPDSWNIIIDWINLKNINLNSYFKHIWYISQDPMIFDWTIEENLLYNWNLNIDEKKINEIIKLSKCEFIFWFKNGLKTTIGERGVKLSGWEKQRLGIAKLFLKNPKIILLDEPTSSLDSISEKDISDALTNLFHNRTIIIIAHRLQTIINADNIFYIENWQIVESWNYQQLKNLWWKFTQMLDYQTKF